MLCAPVDQIGCVLDGANLFSIRVLPAQRSRKTNLFRRDVYLVQVSVSRTVTYCTVLCCTAERGGWCGPSVVEKKFLR